MAIALAATMMRKLVLGTALAFVGCGSEVRSTHEGTTSCGGVLSSEPTILNADLPPDGVLIDAGSTLLFAHALSLGNGNAIYRVDECTGELTKLVVDDWIAAVAVHADHVYFVTHDIMAFYSWLKRTPLEGGEPVDLGDIGTSRIVGSEQGVFAWAYAGDDGRVVRDVTGGPTSESLTQFDSDIVGHSYELLGASSAGLYLWEAYDAGKPLPLRRWPYAGPDWPSVEGTEGATTAIDVHDETLFFFRSAQDVHDVSRVPLDGGEPAVVVDDALAPGFGITALEATNEATCWVAQPSGLSCLAAGSQTARQLDEVEPRSMLLREALYWLRDDGNSAELVAAVP